MNGGRFLRLFIFFDLPTSTKNERSSATKFRNNLIKDGFFMMQYSIYSRICRGQDSIDKYKRKVRSYIPYYGHIRMMQITEKQYANMELLLGNINKQEKMGVKQMILF